MDFTYDILEIVTIIGCCMYIYARFCYRPKKCAGHRIQQDRALYRQCMRRGHAGAERQEKRQRQVNTPALCSGSASDSLKPI